MKTRRGFFASVDRSLAPFVMAFEQSAIVHALGYIAAFISFVAIIISLAQFTLYLDDRKAEIMVRKEEAVQRAWDRIRLPVGGEIGKGPALNLVLGNGAELAGMDLTCRAVGTWDHERGRCFRRPVYSGLKLSRYQPQSSVAWELHPAFSRFRQYDADSVHLMAFNDAEVVRGDFRGMNVLANAGISVLLEESDLSFASLVVVDSDALKAQWCDLSFSEVIISKDLIKPLQWIRGCNVSGMIVNPETVEEGPSANYDYSSIEAWAWADYPPRLLPAGEQKAVPAPPELLNSIWLCDPVYRSGTQGRDPSPSASNDVMDLDAVGIWPLVGGEPFPLNSPGAGDVMATMCRLEGYEHYAGRYPSMYRSH